MLWIPIDRSLEIPLIRQVYEQIRTRILAGDLKAGERLPSTREMSSCLGVSRNVILGAYEQLLIEEYIVAKGGSGTYVAKGAYLEQHKTLEPLSSFEITNTEKQEMDFIDFRSGIPALESFPRKIWSKIAKEVYNESPHSIFGYDNPEGRFELRNVLSRYLRRVRGVQCRPDQLVITSGATQAFSLVAKLLLLPGDEVIIEDPVTHEIQTIFTSPGSSLFPIPVDHYGMRTDLIPANMKPSFVFVTPSHQFPLGGTLPIQRRIQLIQFARKANCYIVEDDYDSEFRYKGVPVSSLQGLAPERVIYIGTLSKILSPALRIGYLVLPPSLIERCRNLKWFSDLHSPSLDQLILAGFFEQRYLEKHIQKMKKVYKKQRKVLIKSLNDQFSSEVKVFGDSTGLHLIAEFEKIEFSGTILDKVLQSKIKVYPVEMHAIRKGIHRHQIILGYGNLTCEKIEEGIRRLKTALVAL